MKTEIQKLRAELERERNAADLAARDSDTYRRERDTLRAEVERLTKELDICRHLLSEAGELATLRATREQDHGAAIECADEIDDPGSKGIIARHMRALIATITNSQQKGGEEIVTVCLCGSSKWPEIHMRVMMEETLSGRIVIPMGLYGHADFPTGARAATNDGDESTEVKQMLDRLHFAKIDRSEEILVVRVDGYIGSSTAREIEYAESKGKKVRFWDEKAPTPHPEGAATKSCVHLTSEQMDCDSLYVHPASATPPSITDAADEIMIYLGMSMLHPLDYRHVESILSRLLGAQAGEVVRLREEVAQLKLKWESDEPGRPGRMSRALSSMVTALCECEGSSRPLTLELSRFVEELRQDARAMNWIVAHVDYIILRPDTLPLSFREKWDSRIVTRENIYAAMQPSDEPKA